ncbi:MAG: response regulator [Alphaproteobacteria bacterium]
MTQPFLSLRDEGTRIVLAEDDSEIAQLMEEALREVGVTSVVAWDSDCGSARTSRQSGNSLPLTDVRMPKMDGYELVKQAISELPDLKIVMMTGHVEESPNRSSSSTRISVF